MHDPDEATNACETLADAVEAATIGGVLIKRLVALVHEHAGYGDPAIENELLTASTYGEKLDRLGARLSCIENRYGGQLSLREAAR